MVDSSVYDRMINLASVGRNDTVLDIGAGLGFLTRRLANECRRVLAVEADPQLADILRQQLVGVQNVEIVQGDVLTANIPAFNKVVSTPPYNISSELLLWLLNRTFELAALVLQNEFAVRLVSPVGSENYGWLTVFVNLKADVELLDVVPRSVFYPEPRVDSVVTRIALKRDALKLRDESAFKRLLQVLFTHRNRKIRGAASLFIRAERRMRKKDVARIVERLPFRERRVRELAPEDFGVLADAVLG